MRFNDPIFMKHLVFFFILLIVLGCNRSVKQPLIKPKPVPPKIIKEFGFTFNNYHYLRDTIKNGESFGAILDAAHIMPARVYEIVKKTKKVFDIRRLKAGNPYVILKSKDSLNKGEIFIYQPDKINYIVFKFKDTITAYRAKKKIKTVLQYGQATMKIKLFLE